jgi:hypothetical protein
MKRIRASVLAGSLLASSLISFALLSWPAVLSSGAACASAGGVGHAALVVGTGTQTLKFCVGLDAVSVSGIHLIELANSQDGLQYRLGFGGLAVCQLAGVGPAGGDCFAKYPLYWGLWLGDGSGGWSWSSSGAGSVQIRDGDLEAWTWGTGASGTTHPHPPATTFASVCGGPSPTVAPSATHAPPRVTPSSPGLTPPPTRAGNPISDPTSGAGRPRASGPRREPGSPSSSMASPSAGGPGQLAAAVGGDATGGGGGPPAGALLAIAGVVALGGFGWLRARAGSRDLDTPKAPRA